MSLEDIPEVPPHPKIHSIQLYLLPDASVLSQNLNQSSQLTAGIVVGTVCHTFIIGGLSMFSVRCWSKFSFYSRMQPYPTEAWYSPLLVLWGRRANPRYKIGSQPWHWKLLPVKLEIWKDSWAETDVSEENFHTRVPEATWDRSICHRMSRPKKRWGPQGGKYRAPI